MRRSQAQRLLPRLFGLVECWKPSPVASLQQTEKRKTGTREIDGS